MSLFNGRDLTGWIVSTGTDNDGSQVRTGRAGSSTASGHRLLFSHRDDTRRLCLHVRFRAEAKLTARSGIALRACAPRSPAAPIRRAEGEVAHLRSQIGSLNQEAIGPELVGSEQHHHDPGPSDVAHGYKPPRSNGSHRQSPARPFSAYRRERSRCSERHAEQVPATEVSHSPD